MSTDFSVTLPFKNQGYLGKEITGLSIDFAVTFELKDIDVSKRPLHCCDSKKDIIYITRIKNIHDETYQPEFEPFWIWILLKP